MNPNLFFRAFLPLIFGLTPTTLPAISYPPRILACVDCYSSMSLAHSTYERLFPGEKVSWVLIQSEPYNDVNEDFMKSFPADSIRLRLGVEEGGYSEQAIVDQCKRMGVEYFVGGMDTGSFVASKLNFRAGFKDNDPNKADIRLSKLESAKVSGKFGIPTYALKKTDDTLKNLEDAKKWIAEQRWDTFTIKPDVGFFGRDTFYISKKALLSDDRHLLDLLRALESFLIQPKIEGRFFYANTYSKNGVSRVTASSEYFQILNNDKPAYFANGFLDLNSFEVLKMGEAAEFLLPAHGIYNGPAHPEFIIEYNTGKLYLLEMNARVAGLGTPELDRQIYGMSHLELHFLSLFNEERFWPAFNSFPRPRLKRGFMYIVASPTEGYWSEETLGIIQQQKSYLIPSERYLLDSRRKVKASTSMNEIAGTLFLSHQDPRVVKRDFLALANLFDQGRFFRKAGSDPTCPGAFNDTEQHSKLRNENKKALKKIDWSRF